MEDVGPRPFRAREGVLREVGVAPDEMVALSGGGEGEVEGEAVCTAGEMLVVEVGAIEVVPPAPPPTEDKVAKIEGVNNAGVPLPRRFAVEVACPTAGEGVEPLPREGEAEKEDDRVGD